MTEEQLDKIFDPFTQADSATSKNFGGTGLGLTITREFSRMMGGDITVTSKIGIGTTFTMKVLENANLGQPSPVQDSASNAGNVGDGKNGPDH